MSTLSWQEIEDRAVGFRKAWEAQKGAERQQAQRFVTEFLAVFGVENPQENGGEFEHKCSKEWGDDGYIDYFLPKKLVVEMKSKGKNLKKAFEQVRDYVFHLPAEEIPELVLVCDFDRFELYHRTTVEHVSFRLKDFRRYIRHFADIAGYIPMGFVNPDIIANDSVQMIPNATLYHFGILTSSVHMAWMRAVCGRLKSDYRYSKDIVYNNFPWPELDGKQGVGGAKIKVKESTEDYKKRMEARISLCAEVILQSRNKYSASSLADLYDPLTMPPDLRNAHKDLDKAVMELYGYAPDLSESEIVADLMVRYQRLVDAENGKSAKEESDSPEDKPKRTRKKSGER